MKRLIFALALLLAAPAFAQTAPNLDKIAKAWKFCDQPGQRAVGRLAIQRKAAGQSIWRDGFEKCADVEEAYLESKAAIDAKAAADATAAEAGFDALATDIKAARAARAK